MRKTLFIIVAVVLLITGCTGQYDRWKKDVAIDSLTSILYDMMSDQPKQALAFIDSLKDEGIYSEGIANCRRAQVYSEQFQPRVSEVFALRAVKDEDLKKENLRYHYFAYVLLINSEQNMGNTERAMTLWATTGKSLQPDGDNKKHHRLCERPGNSRQGDSRSQDVCLRWPTQGG